MKETVLNRCYTTCSTRVHNDSNHLIWICVQGESMIAFMAHYSYIVNINGGFWNRFCQWSL